MFEKLGKDQNKEKAGESPSAGFVNTLIAKHNNRQNVKKERPAADPGLDSRVSERILKLENKGRRRGKRFSFIGIGGGLLISAVIIYISYLILSEIKSLTQLADQKLSGMPDISEEMAHKPRFKKAWKDCLADSDCMEVEKACCGCAEGGAMTAINKDFYAIWQEERAAKCDASACLGEYLCQKMSASCIDKICELSVSEPEDISGAISNDSASVVGSSSIYSLDQDTGVYTNYRLGFSFNFPKFLPELGEIRPVDRENLVFILGEKSGFLSDEAVFEEPLRSDYVVLVKPLEEPELLPGFVGQYFGPDCAYNQGNFSTQSGVYQIDIYLDPAASSSSSVCETSGQYRILWNENNGIIAAWRSPEEGPAENGLVFEEEMFKSFQFLEIDFGELDFDGDGLDNSREESLSTDILSRDTDNDGFDDGDEVNNGYNPRGAGRLE